LGLQARRSSPATAPFSLHAALPIYVSGQRAPRWSNHASRRIGSVVLRGDAPLLFWLRAFSVNRRTLCRSLIQRGVLRDEHARRLDRKSTRLNSSHVKISYAVFCLKK